ncbi:hypothetical protein Tco_1244340 [Tanacetum coccineum]
MMALGWDWSYMAEEDENHALVADEEEVPTEYALMAKSSSSSDNEYSVVPPPPVQVYSPPKKDFSWMGLPEFVDETVTDYSRSTPSVDVSKDVSASSIKQGGSFDNVVSKPMIRNTSQSPKVMSSNFGLQSLRIGILKMKGSSRGERNTNQQQHLLMEQRIQSQDLEITQLKNRVKTLEDNEKSRICSKGCSKHRGDGSRGGFDDWICGKDLPTAAPAGVATASGSFPTAAIFTTASVTTPYTRRTRASRGIIIEPSHTTSVPTINAKGKGKEKMVDTTGIKKKKIQEQLDAQVAKEMEMEFAREEQLIREQGERDAEIARAQAEKELGMMIAEQAEADLSLEEKMELITELIKYQRNLAEIKKYQAQQSKPSTKTEKRNFYMAILKSHAGWKSKDFRGMTFEQIEEKFIPVWKQLQDFVPMNFKTESERVKRPGIQLAQESSKRLKTAKASGSEPSQEHQTKDSKELSEEELKKMMEIVLVEEVYIEALQAKYPIIEWEIYSV